MPDEQLLDLRLCDLRLNLRGTGVQDRIQRLYRELAARGIAFRPHAWLAQDWFSPDGVPGFAVPFYLAHPRLTRLERKMTGVAEGTNANWQMRILRHEAGHAIDSAYRLRRRNTGLRSAISAISSSTYCSFFKAGQPSYRLRQFDRGVSHTAKVSAKSSVGCACAYHSPRCCTWW